MNKYRNNTVSHSAGEVLYVKESLVPSKVNKLPVSRIQIPSLNRKKISIRPTIVTS